jgi:branched-chain amino acid transport system substrate-binding protein
MNARIAAKVAAVIAIVGLLLLLTVAVGQATDERDAAIPPSPGFPVKLGLVAPFTGPVPSFGERTRDGALVAIQQAETAGWDIQTLQRDSQCSSEHAVTATNDLIFNQGVHYLIGAVCSSASRPMSEIAQANQVVQISPVSTAPDITKLPDGTSKDYVFRACFLDPFQGKAMAVLARDLGANEVAVLYNADNSYVRDLAQYFKGDFEALGGTVPVYESYAGDQSDFSELLSQVEAADPDALFLPGFPEKVNTIAEQADALDFAVTFLGVDLWDSPDLRIDLLEGAYFSTHFWPGDPRQVVVEFVAAYSATYGTTPDFLAALAYDATAILLQAVAEAGVDDASLVRDQLAAAEYQGVTGEIAFDEYGDPLKGAAIIHIAGGERELERHLYLHITELTHRFP